MVFALVFVGCKKDKNDDNNGGGGNVNKIESSYFAIPNGDFVNSNFPSASSDVVLDDVRVNQTALPGGNLPVSINFEGGISKVYVGVQGVEGYYAITPSAKSTAEETQFMITVSQNLTESFTILISVLAEDGTVTQVFTKEISYLVAGTGALQISLAFDNEKDVDLYVIRPDSLVIYYGNKGPGEYDENYVYSRIWGLDIDSNAGCIIDSVNNENVFFPNGYVMSGTYQVWISMWSNCSPQERVTHWGVTATYQGNIIGVSSGANPAAGVFAIDEPSCYLGEYIYEEKAIKVMEFTITNGDDSLLDTDRVSFPLSETAKEKLKSVVF